MTPHETEADDRDARVSTLRVRIEGAEPFFERVEAALDDRDGGDAAGRTPSRGLSLPDEEALARVFTAQNLQLVRAIARHEPSSMRELAGVVGRDIKNVSANLNELAALGLVDLIEEGRAKRPVVPYDELEVVYLVRGRGGEPPPSEAPPADD